MRALKLVSLVNFQASPSWGCSTESRWLKRAFSSALSPPGTAQGRYRNAERFWSSYCTCDQSFSPQKPANKSQELYLDSSGWGCHAAQLEAVEPAAEDAAAPSSSPAPCPPRRMSSEWPAAFPNLTPGIWRGVRPGGNELGRAPVSSNQLGAAARAPRRGRSTAQGSACNKTHREPTQGKLFKIYDEDQL